MSMGFYYINSARAVNTMTGEVDACIGFFIKTDKVMYKKQSLIINPSKRIL